MKMRAGTVVIFLVQLVCMVVVLGNSGCNDLNGRYVKYSIGVKNHSGNTIYELRMSNGRDRILWGQLYTGKRGAYWEMINLDISNCLKIDFVDHLGRQHKYEFTNMIPANEKELFAEGEMEVVFLLDPDYNGYIELIDPWGKVETRTVYPDNTE